MRSGFEGWRPPKGCNDAQLRSRLKPLAEPYPKYGCPTLHDILVIEGDVVNKKRTYRIYRKEGLRVRTKKLLRPRTPIRVPDAVNQRWSMDFVSDQLANGRRCRVLCVADDFSRGYCTGLHWFASIKDARSTN
jgi:putative transposase